jgi:hypothetical protein
MNPVFFLAGEFARGLISKCAPQLTVKKMISSYGPFKVSAKFIFSDFASWSSGHNAGFGELVERSKGKKCVLDI